MIAVDCGAELLPEVVFSLCHVSPVSAPYIQHSGYYSSHQKSVVEHLADLKDECWPFLPHGHLLTRAALCPSGAQALLTVPSGQLHTFLASRALGHRDGLLRLDSHLASSSPSFFIRWPGLDVCCCSGTCESAPGDGSYCCCNGRKSQESEEEGRWLVSVK